MILLAIFLSFLLFTPDSYAAVGERFLSPELAAPEEESLTNISNFAPKGSTIYLEEVLLHRGLEFNPNVKHAYVDYLQTDAEMNQNYFNKPVAQRKVSLFCLVPEAAIRAYRRELKRNDEARKMGAPLDISD